MWDKILTLAFMGSFLSAAVRMAIPLAYAALGEMISQKSGTINIGLEANMLGGAFLGFAVTYWTGSLPLGFLAGMIAILAMILPGISGSTLLLIFGLYIPIMEKVKAFISLDFSAMTVLIIFGLGMIAGIVTFTKLIRMCLEKFRSQTVYTILGMMLGSLYSIVMGATTLDIPKPAMTFSTFNIITFILGGVIITGLELLKRYFDKTTK